MQTTEELGKPGLGQVVEKRTKDPFDARGATLLHAVVQRHVNVVSIPEAYLDRKRCKRHHILASTPRPQLVKQSERLVCVSGSGMTEAQEPHG